MPIQNTDTNNWKKTFFPFWIGQAFSLFGSMLVQFALVWWLTKETGSASILATATAFAILPEIFISPFAGAIVDRFNRKKLIIISDGAIAIATVILAILFYFNLVAVWHVYLMMFLRAVGGAFHYPAEQSSISLMVPAKHLARIAGLNQSLKGAVNIIAPPLGALLLETVNVQGALSVDFITAVFAIIILLFIQIPQPKETGNGELVTFKSLINDIKDGFLYILHWKGLVALIGLAMVIKIALSPAFSLVPLLVNKHFLGNAAQYGLIESFIGIGVVLGGLLLGIWGGFKKKINSIWLGVILMGISFMWISVLRSDQFKILIPATLMLGFMIPIVDGPFMAILQSKVAPEYQGRVFTMTGSLLWLTTPIGLGMAGPIADWLGIQIWYALAGILCLISSFGIFLLPVLKNIEDNNNHSMPK
jgi:DHA3 family macrolide efflux protein-like MFS transporter